MKEVIEINTNDDSDLWKEKGNQFYIKENYEEAAKCYHQALEINPKSSSTWHNLGMVCRKLGKVEDSQFCFKQAEQYTLKSQQKSPVSPKKPMSKKLGIIALISILIIVIAIITSILLFPPVSNQKTSAEPSVIITPTLISPGSTQVNTNPDTAPSLIKKGDDLATVGRFSDALSNYERAIDLDPQNLDAWRGKGRSLLSLDKIGEANSFLQEATKRFPNDYKLWNYLGYTWEQKVAPSNAIDNYKIAVKLNSTDGNGWFHLGYNYYILGQDQSALDAYNEALKFNPNDLSTLKNKALVLEHLGRYDEAQEILKKVAPDLISTPYPTRSIVYSNAVSQKIDGGSIDGNIQGDQVLSKDTSLSGIITGDVIVLSGVNFNIKGMMNGNLEMQSNSIVINSGTVSGDITNNGGNLQIYGIVNGDVIRKGGSTYIDPKAIISGQII